MLTEGDNVISSISESFGKTVRPFLEVSKEYGLCPEERKKDFLYKIDQFQEFLTCTKNNITKSKIKFEVSHELYKGFLLVPHQIEATSKRRDKVAEVEQAFSRWMKLIKEVISEWHQIVKVLPTHGPATELEHWRKMLTKFSVVSEFVNSKAFKNFHQCLRLSRSKLISEWKKIDDEINTLMNEAADNVWFVAAIEKFWEPLYRCSFSEMTRSISNLLETLRTVYNSSNFYNTDVRMTGFLLRVVNQLILASTNEITQKRTISVWSISMTNLSSEIDNYKKLQATMQSSYHDILYKMTESGETPFTCSETHLFYRLNSFELRLIKISEIKEVHDRYQGLNRISGLETFLARINVAFKLVTEKTYDPLAYRLEEFDNDYVDFQKEVNSVESDLAKFVERYVLEIETVDMRLLTLKRFERLNLECLSLDSRYLDVAVMLETEMKDIQDKYNEERANPPIGRNVPPVIGRIMWARCLLRKVEDPMNVLKARECVINHPKVQICVKYYNYLAEILFHYQALQHKAWFTYASQVRSKLESPLIGKNPESNRYVLNLDPTVLQVIKETESMWKLKLEVPECCSILTYCKHRVINAYEVMKELLIRNNKLRSSIYPMFVPMMRVQLIKLEEAFAPCLSTVTWLSQNLDENLSRIHEVLLPIENFVKDVTDINDAQLEKLFKSIESQILVYLPEAPVEPEELLQLNVEHRKTVEKKIERFSLAAENAAIDLINRFVEKSEVLKYESESGKYQLHPNLVDESNWRDEEKKPIDIFDWLSFEKLYKPVGYAPPEENEKYCFEDYKGLKYDVTLLHLDCTELFAFYNHKMIAALVACTIRSMELLKKRSNVSEETHTLVCGALSEKALLKASIELIEHKFRLVPSMSEMNKVFQATLQNILETHYGVATWGKQAKTEERKKRRPLLDEVKHERTWFKLISEHNEVVRYKITLDKGLLPLDGKIKSIMNGFFDKYNYLWAENLEEEIGKFVDEDPLTSDIRDKFLDFNRTTETILNLETRICVRTININCESMINVLAEVSKKRKSILATKLGSNYRVIIDEIVTFMQSQQRILKREIVGPEDCQKLMKSTEIVRENQIRLDQSVNLIEDIFIILASFNIENKDANRVRGLRVQFNLMIKTAEAKHIAALKFQDSLQYEASKF